MVRPRRARTTGGGDDPVVSKDEDIGVDVSNGDVDQPLSMQCAADVDLNDMGVEELRTELRAARSQLRALQSQQKDKTCRIGALTTAPSPPDVAEMQEKVARLRREQQELEGVRDKAWKQLKAVVQEIGSLAHPDYLQSLQISKAQE